MEEKTRKKRKKKDKHKGHKGTKTQREEKKKNELPAKDANRSEGKNKEQEVARDKHALAADIIDVLKFQGRYY